MSGADDLRDVVARALWPVSDEQWNNDFFEVDKRDALSQSDAVMAVLSDPVRRLALLELIGDVREGWTQPEGYADCVTFAGPPFPVGDPVLVVRPRGGAADG